MRLFRRRRPRIEQKDHATREYTRELVNPLTGSLYLLNFEKGTLVLHRDVNQHKERARQLRTQGLMLLVEGDIEYTYSARSGTLKYHDQTVVIRMADV